MYRKVVKRVLDVLIAILLLVLFAIPMILIAIAIKLEDHGPVFFKQYRTGRYGKVFQLIKFRSMKVDNDVHDFKCADKHTKVGKFLRRTSLDEIPQVFNILKGEMSLVGPRAVIDDEIEYFGKHKEEVLSVKPGITGYWAANGRSNTSYDERVEMETYYANNVSIPLDIKILFKTVISVIKKEGAV